jgi:YfiH family protein
LRGDGEEDEWALVARALRVPAARLARLAQVHGTTVATLRKGDAVWNGDRPPADVVMTNDPAIAVAVQVADCVPVLLSASDGQAVAAVHAGWRGTKAGAVMRAVAAMSEQFGVEPGLLRAAVGPSIGPCCYTVGPEVEEAFSAAFGADVEKWFRRDGDAMRLDLWRSNVDQLVMAGVDPASIGVAALCTSCRGDLFHSYRRDGPGTGRIAAAVRCRSVSAE